MAGFRLLLLSCVGKAAKEEWGQTLSEEWQLAAEVAGATLPSALPSPPMHPLFVSEEKF